MVGTARRVGMRISYASRAAAQMRQGISMCIGMRICLVWGRRKAFIPCSLSADRGFVNICVTIGCIEAILSVFSVDSVAGSSGIRPMIVDLSVWSHQPEGSDKIHRHPRGGSP